MPDISKCFGAHCEVKESCYRYTAPSNDYWQSYISPNNPGKDCGYYWRVRRMRANILLLAMLLTCGNAWAEECIYPDWGGIDAKNLYSICSSAKKAVNALEEIARKMPEPKSPQPPNPQDSPWTKNTME